MGKLREERRARGAPGDRVRSGGLWLAVFGLGLVSAGCELIVDFDRSQIGRLPDGGLPPADAGDAPEAGAPDAGQGPGPDAAQALDAGALSPDAATVSDGGAPADGGAHADGGPDAGGA